MASPFLVEEADSLPEECPVASRACRTFAELLIDCEEDRTVRAVLVEMLREMGR